MSALNKMLDFYIIEAWKKTEDGVLVPSAALLADRGVMAMEYKHASHGLAHHANLPESAIQAAYQLSTAEIAEALRDLILAQAMPHGEARTMKLGSACVGLQNAEFRIRSVTKS